MSGITTTSSAYVMGHNDRERRRLAAQAAILEPITEQLLRRAGLAAGMSVVDFGCGVGDVSLLAARLVGPGGRVKGLDIDEPTLMIARQRALEQGLTNITFERTSVIDFRVETPVDATIGRHILIHMTEPLALLEAAFAALQPGGVAVFQEYDFSVLHPAYPSVPLRDRMAEIFRDFFAKATRANIGTQLYHLAVRAGFSSVECRAEYDMGGGADSPYYEWFVESLRSILPRAEALGVLRASDVEIDTLAMRLRQEAVANASCFPAPVMVGCIARKP
jgi:cyclopropane fatty-acyl-phospholipid synthase-like methyltransferase